jgi:hypothetical protein
MVRVRVRVRARVRARARARVRVRVRVRAAHRPALRREVSEARLREVLRQVGAPAGEVLGRDQVDLGEHDHQPEAQRPRHVVVQRGRHVQQRVAHVSDDGHDVGALERAPELPPHLEVVLEGRDPAGVGAAARVHLGQPRREALLLQELLRFGVSA